MTREREIKTQSRTPKLVMKEGGRRPHSKRTNLGVLLCVLILCSLVIEHEPLRDPPRELSSWGVCVIGNSLLPPGSPLKGGWVRRAGGVAILCGLLASSVHKAPRQPASDQPPREPANGQVCGSRLVKGSFLRRPGNMR